MLTKTADNPMHLKTRKPSRLRRAPRCLAQTRRGTPCQSPAVAGKTRCRMHGGAAGSVGYEHALRSLRKGNGDEANGIAEYADEFRRMAARGAASTVLALAENLPKIVDATSVQGQDVSKCQKLPWTIRHSTWKSSATSSPWRCVSVLANTDFN